MKCPTCGKGIMEKIEESMEQDHVPYEAYKCAKCGEEIMIMRQLKSLAAKYRKLRKAKEITFPNK